MTEKPWTEDGDMGDEYSTTGADITHMKLLDKYNKINQTNFLLLWKEGT